jgi:hypothetical protein
MYTEDTIDIRRHKETRNRFKYDLLALPSTWRIRDKNTNSVLSSIHHNLWLKTIQIYKDVSVLKSTIKTIKTFITFRHVSISYEIILREFVISLLRSLSFNLLKYRRLIVVMWQRTFGMSALCVLWSCELDSVQLTTPQLNKEITNSLRMISY